MCILDDHGDGDSDSEFLLRRICVGLLYDCGDVASLGDCSKCMVWFSRMMCGLDYNVIS